MLTTYNSSTIPDELFTLLKAHLPSSIVILRRLQYMKLPGGTSSHALIIFCSNSTGLSEGETKDEKFTIAYWDFAGGLDTQMYLYSTLQDDTYTIGLEAGGSSDRSKEPPELGPHGENGINGQQSVVDGKKPGEEREMYKTQLKTLVAEIIRLRGKYTGALAYPEALLLGSLHIDVKAILHDLGTISPTSTLRKPVGYDKWLFRTEDLPHVASSLATDVEGGSSGDNRGRGLAEGMRWDVGSREDCAIAVERTDIPRQPASLVRWPNLFVKLDNDTPIAWAFLGQDGALCSLHVEEGYRGRGLAKILAAKLFREKTLLYGDDGWCSCDVATANEQSRAVCRALGGQPSWVVNWVFLNIGHGLEQS